MESKNEFFGVEIECHVKQSMIDAYGWQMGRHSCGIQIPNFPQGWTAKPDASVRAHESGYVGIEIVSPKLKGEDGLTQLVAVADFLAEEGTKVGPDCGLHIHVNAGHMDARAIDNLKSLFIAYETAFYGLNGKGCKSRMGNRYCVPVSGPYGFDGSRYHSLNLTNVGSRDKNTVEVRCFFGTIDAYVLVSAVYMVVSIAMRAINGKLHTANVDRSTPVKAMRDFVYSTFDANGEADADYIIVDSAESHADIITTMMKAARVAKTA